MKVEFTGTAAHHLDWQIEPADTVKVNVGAVTVVEYKVKNASNRDITSQAIPSVTPMEGAKHLVKIECFCFTEQRLAAGEERLMPVQFYVDPNISEDIKTLTLSYSFYEVKKNEVASGSSGETDMSQHNMHEGMK